MKEYFIGIMAVAFLGSTLLTLAPTGFEKHLRLLCGFCAVAAVLFPLVSFLSDGIYIDGEWTELFAQGEAEAKNYDEIYNCSLVMAEGENAEGILKNDIIKELDLKNDSFDIKIIIDKSSDEYSILRTELIIYASGIDIDPHSVEKYIKTRLGCDCEIIYDLKMQS